MATRKYIGSTFGGECEAVGDKTPRESTFENGTTALFQVFTQQRLATRDGDEHLMGIGLARNTVEHSQEIFTRHIPDFRQLPTVAATMATTYIATQGTLPKQLSKGMLLADVTANLCCRFQGYVLAKTQFTHSPLPSWDSRYRLFQVILD